MSTTTAVYAVYRTVASGAEGVGYVVNNIVWDGVSAIALGTGVTAVADPDRQYLIGSTYSAGVQT
jgi:hypothetical protein